MIIFRIYVTGWWLSPTPLKNDGVSNGWDDENPNVWKVLESHKIHVLNHQPGKFTRYGSVSKPCTPGEHQNSW